MDKTVESNLRVPLVYGKRSKEDVENDIVRTILAPPAKGWLIAFGISIFLLMIGGFCVWTTWWRGIGMWGENKTINWAWDITNFVWWIGIGHAGTLISAILLLFRSKWRNSVNRAAEAMTLCAVTCSAFFIVAHVGRPWLVHFIFPYPNAYGSLWPNFNSALVWDAFAILTYFTVSLVYWYLGLIPDLATLRERTTGFRRWMYKIFSLNWDSSAWTWRRYKAVMLVIAGLATALVVSVHSIVSMDFASGIIPGWHSTIFPPYFVAGAILSGFAMVLTLLIIARATMKLENYITIDHIDKMNQIVILNSGIIAITYFTEPFISYYSGNFYEMAILDYRAKGFYQISFIIMYLCNAILPQLLWIKKLRRNILFTFIMALLVNLGMWIERFVLIVTSIAHDFLPSSWTFFIPTLFDIGTFLFSVGLFLFLFLLFIRYIPVINISEVKELAESSLKQEAKPLEEISRINRPEAFSVAGAKKIWRRRGRSRYRQDED